MSNLKVQIWGNPKIWRLMKLTYNMAKFCDCGCRSIGKMTRNQFEMALMILEEGQILEDDHGKDEPIN